MPHAPMRRRSHVIAFGCVVVTLGCAETATRRRPVGALEAQHRMSVRTRAAGPAPAATVLYRATSVSHGSSCRMFPSDSRAFDVRARTCGAPWAAVAGVARLFTEVGASAETHAPVLADGRLRWLDFPDPCGP